MPLWNIYHPPGTFETAEEKDIFVQDINGYYTGRGGLPAFYIIVNFHLMAPGTFYRGLRCISPTPEGEAPFIRIAVSHLAVNPDGLAAEGLASSKAAAYERIRGGDDKACQRAIVEKGYSWEYGVSEEPRELWKIDGFVPPRWRSEAEKMWRDEDRAVPWEGAAAGKL